MAANNISVQIGNIVSNSLVGKSPIFLPSIGSLAVDSIPSKLKSSGKSMLAPQCVVRFTAAEVGVNIIDIISHAASCDRAVAESIYMQWFESLPPTSDITIEGVGTIKGGRVILTNEFNSALNPEIPRVLKLKKRRGGLVWILLSVAAGVVVGVVANYIFNENQQYFVPSVAEVAIHEEIVEPKAVEVEVEVEVAEPEVAEPEVSEIVVSESEVTEFAAPEPQEVATPPQRQVQATQEVITENANPRYRLVYGVFSTMDNAQKAVADITQKGTSARPNIRPYGKLFMVSVVESDLIEDCKSFMQSNVETFPDLWISKRRGE